MCYALSCLHFLLLVLKDTSLTFPESTARTASHAHHQEDERRHVVSTHSSLPAPLVVSPGAVVVREWWERRGLYRAAAEEDKQATAHARRPRPRGRPRMNARPSDERAANSYSCSIDQPLARRSEDMHQIYFVLRIFWHHPHHERPRHIFCFVVKIKSEAERGTKNGARGVGMMERMRGYLLVLLVWSLVSTAWGSRKFHTKPFFSSTSK